MLNTNEIVSLRPYLVRFLLTYAGACFLSVVIVCVLEWLGVDLLKYNIGFVIHIAALMCATSTVTTKFIKNHLRFFTKRELNNMIVSSTFLSWLFQTIIMIIYMGVMRYLETLFQSAPEVRKDISLDPVTQMIHMPFWILLILLSAFLILTFAIQSYNFRSFALRCAKRMNSNIKIPDSNC